MLFGLDKVCISLFNLSFPLATSLFSVSSIDIGIFMSTYDLVCSFQMTATLIFERFANPVLSTVQGYPVRATLFD